MPRAHTPEERVRIVDALMASGRERFASQGLHRTSVAELARDAGIGKGSFYGFFESKEALFFAIHEAEERAFERELDAAMEACVSGPEAVRTLLLATSERVELHPFLRLLLEPEVLRTLLVRVPPATLEAHRADDRRRYLDLAARWQARGWIREDVDPEDFFATLTASFMLSLQRDLMGPEAHRRAARSIAEAVARAWCP